jgi:hypothetical protein
MTRENQQPIDPDAAHSQTPALVAVATGLADGIRSLVPTCTVGVIVGVGAQWQLLAQHGPADIASTWRASVAARVRDSDRAIEDADTVVTPFSSVTLHALLVLVAEPGGHVEISADGFVQPLLAAGGVLLDRALAAQRRDRALRRVVLECRARNGYRLRTIDDLELALHALWPEATVKFHACNAIGSAPSSLRGPLRTACNLGLPTVSRTPAHDGLLPRDLAFRVAIPMPAHEGALLIEAHAAGEEPDAESVATAIELTQRVDGRMAATAPPAAPTVAVTHA